MTEKPKSGGDLFIVDNSDKDWKVRERRKKIEGYIKNLYFKRVQAPVGVKAALKCWLELCT